MVCAKGIKMNSCAHLLDKKNTHVCGAALATQRWVFLWMDLQIFLVNFEHIFLLCRFVKVSNGCCMEHLQGFEGLV
jgi:hypothetical protein